MANLSKTTQDHEEIRRWAEERGGKPAHVKSTESGDDIGIIRIDFPGYSGEGSLEEITWDEFFEKFDDNDLALVYQEETADGERSNFNKIVKAETVDLPEKKASSAPLKKGSPSKAAAKKASAKKAPAKKVAQKSAAKKVASKAAAKKAPAKKTAAKRVGAKKTALKKVAAKKTAAKKTAAKKTAPAKKSATKKSAAKKSSSRSRR